MGKLLTYSKDAYSETDRAQDNMYVLHADGQTAARPADVGVSHLREFKVAR
jgi:hypothetical protein